MATICATSLAIPTQSPTVSTMEGGGEGIGVGEMRGLSRFERMFEFMYTA